MKKLFFLLCFLEPFILNAQPYYPVLKENKYWDQFNYYFPSVCQYVSGGRTYLCGDTIINSLSYKKICYYPILSTIGTPFCPPYYVSLTGNSEPDYFIREDTIARKVYFLSTINNEPEYLLYDFNLSIGDTLDTEYDLGLTLVVDTIVNVTLYNGNVRRKFDFGNNMYYIEEIGGNKGLCMPLPDGIGFGSILICVNDSMSIYGDQCNLWFNNVNEIPESDFSYSIDENGIFMLQTVLNLRTLEIYDVCGKNIFTSAINSHQARADLSGFSSGIYIVKAATTQNRTFTIKIYR
ncbi:MAG: T9SS type A sorting domain-containing protein [Bacteroidota bacterium]